MLKIKGKQNSDYPERDTRNLIQPEMQNGERESTMELMEKLKELEEKLEVSNQQIVMYQGLQELRSDEVFKYNLIQQLQKLNRNINGIGLSLVEIGKILEEQREILVKKEETKKVVPVEKEKKRFKMFRPFAKKQDDEEEEEREDEEEEEEE